MPFASAFNGAEHEKKTILGCGLYAIKQHPKAGSNCGPAPKLEDVVPDEAGGEGTPAYDIVDEAIYYFKSNMMHKTFEVKGPADRLILYMTLYIQQCLKRLLAAGKTAQKTQARQMLLSLAIERSPSPLDQTYPFSAFHPPASKCGAGEADAWGDYAKQLRLEIGVRLIQRIFAYPEADGTASKWWLCFGNTKFLGAQLEGGAVLKGAASK
jgi:actin related protein 2/3 complex subunit 3